MSKLPPSLDIFYEDQHVGKLSVIDPHEVYRLEYNESWMREGMALSVRLPLTQAVYEGNEVRYFFDNLLPEERVRAKVSKRHQVSESNIYGLLCYIGRECAGAFSLIPEGEAPTLPSDDDYKLLPMEELAQKVEQLRTAPFLSDEKKVSMSLAGAQEKLPVLRRGRYFYLPQNGAPSNRILKPDIEGIESSVINEYYCLSLAQSIGLNTVSSRVLPLNGRNVLCVERYDREKRDGAIHRLHQEDFCQVLGLPHNKKYEDEGGPGFADCAQVIRRYSSASTADILQLCDWAVFNACVGNADAHAKNLSFLYKNREIRLAPFYDIVSTTFYENSFAQEMAMHLGGARLLKNFSRTTWEAFARDIDLPPHWVLQRVGEICKLFISKMTPEADALIAAGLNPHTVNRLLLSIASRTRTIQGGLNRA